MSLHLVWTQLLVVSCGKLFLELHRGRKTLVSFLQLIQWMKQRHYALKWASWSKEESSLASAVVSTSKISLEVNTKSNLGSIKNLLKKTNRRYQSKSLWKAWTKSFRKCLEAWLFRETSGIAPCLRVNLVASFRLINVTLTSRNCSIRSLENARWSRPLATVTSSLRSQRKNLLATFLGSSSVKKDHGSKNTVCSQPRWRWSSSTSLNND